LDRFNAEGIAPDMVQVGNEIHHGMLWDDGAIWLDGQSNWSNFTILLKSAISGIREAEGGQEMPVMIHGFGTEPGGVKYYMDSLSHYKVEFDIIGISYYLCWSGGLGTGIQLYLIKRKIRRRCICNQWFSLSG